MSRRGRLILYSTLAGGGLVLLLAMATPVGPWAITRLLGRLAAGEGWTLAVAGHSGSLASGFALEGVVVTGEAAGVRVAIERLEVSLWSYLAKVVGPQVRVELAPEQEEAAPAAEAELPRLPVESLPELLVERGKVQVVWTESGRRLEIEDLDAHYLAVGDTLGQLTAKVPRLLLVEGGEERVRGELTAELGLGPQSVAVHSLALAATVDTLDLEAGIYGRLALLPGLPTSLQLTFRMQSRPVLPAAESSVWAALEVEAEGQLQPLALQVVLAGHGHHPQVQTFELGARIAADAAKVRLDSLQVGLLGGSLEAQAEYYSAADSLAGWVRVRGVDWAGLAGGVKSGPADGELRVALNLREERYEADLELVLHQLELLSGQPLEVHLQAAHRPDRQTRVELRAPVLELVASGRVDPAEVPAAGSYDLELAGTLWPAALVDLQAAPVKIAGRARPDTLQVRLTTPRLPEELGTEFGALAVDLKLLENRLLEAQLTLEQKLVQLRLRLDLAEGMVESLSGSLAPLALERLVPGLQGEVHGTVRAAGGLAADKLRLSGQFEIEGLEYEGWRTGPIALGLDFENGVATGLLQGSGLRLEARLDTSLNLSGQGVFAGVQLFHQQDSLHLEEAASLTGRLVWQGNLRRPETGQGRLDLEELRLRQGDWEVETLRPLAVSYADQELRCEQVELQTPVGPLLLTGNTRADSLALALTLPALDLGQVAPQLRAAGEGELWLAGTLQQPRVAGRVELHQVQLDTLLLGDVRLSLALEDSLGLRAALFQHAVDTPAAEVALSAPAGLLFQGISDTTSGAVILRFAAHRMDLAAPLTYALAQPARGWLELEGSLSAPLARLDSSLSWRDLRGEVVFAGLHLDTEMEGDSLRLEMVPEGRVELADEQLVLQDLQVQLGRYDRESRGFLPAGKMTLGGGLQGTSGSQLTLAMEGVDLLTFNGPEGTADLQALVGGSLQQPEIQVDLKVETAYLGALRGQLTSDAHRARLWSCWTTPLADSLVVRGELPWDWEQERVDYAGGWLRAYSPGIDLSIFSDQLAEYELDRLNGRVGVDLQVEGLGETMSLEGPVWVEDLELALIDIKPVYVFPTGRLVFSGRRGELVDFVSPAGKENGRMALSGQVDLSALDEPRFAVRLETEDLAFRYEEIFRAPEIDMALDFEGSLAASRVAGNVRLRNALAEPLLVAFNAPPVPPPPPALRDEFLENMALQVFVDIRDLEVDSELAKAGVSGAVEIGGTFYKPVFQGDIEIDEGQVFILNRQFDFQRGRIVLNSLVPTRSILDVAYDPLILDPELDLEATCKVVDVNPDADTEFEVTLSVQGTALNPAPEFTSVPAQDFNNIFNLLAFGSISSAEGEGYGAVLGTAAGQLLSGQVEKVGLDEFMVLPSSTVIGSDPGRAALRMGKYFDQIPFPVWVRYEAPIHDMSWGEVRLEHKIKPYLTLSGTAQSKYDRYGLGLGLKKDF